MSEEHIAPRKMEHRRPWRSSALYITLLLIWVVLSRLPYLTDFESIGKDGPEYINSLALDESYNVPPPGNIGFVLLARVTQLIWPTPVFAYAAVNIAITDGCPRGESGPRPLLGGSPR